MRPVEHALGIQEKSQVALAQGVAMALGRVKKADHRGKETA